MRELTQQDKPPETRLPQAGQKEQLYERIEQKLALMREIWNYAKNLPPPTPFDKGEEAEENTLFEGLIKKATKSFPSAAFLIKEYDDIAARMVEIAGNKQMPPPKKLIDELSRLCKQQERLLEDQNVRFTISVRIGIRDAQKKRRKIRSVLNENRDSTDQEFYLKLMPQEIAAHFAGKITAVVPQNFSIAYLVEPEVYKAYQKNDSKGFSLSWADVALTFIKDERNKERRESEDETEENQITEDMLVTVQHENFHAFIEGFGLGDKVYFSAEPLMELAEKIIETDDNPASRLLKEIDLKRLKTLLSKFKDFGHEELIAEIASSPRSGVPKSSFAKKQLELTEAIIKYIFLLGGVNPELDEILADGLKKLDFTRDRKFIQKMYREVEARAPDKMEDFDMAFALFPPSDWRNIERLVKRWITKG